MAKIHEIRRQGPGVHIVNGTTYTFIDTNGTRGHMVCDIENEADAATFLAHTDSFKLYNEPVWTPVATVSVLEAQAEPVPNVIAEPVTDGTFVLSFGGDELDLRTMTDDELRNFATVNNIVIHHAAKGDTIRTKIVQAMQAGA